MDIRVVLGEWLASKGFDGLYNNDEGCGCELKELMPCSDDYIGDCEPGYRDRCDCRDDDEGGEESEGHEFHINPEKALKEAENE